MKSFAKTFVNAIYKRSTGKLLEIRPLHRGSVYDCDDPEDIVFKFMEIPSVPDWDHQSSLDYLEGV